MPNLALNRKYEKKLLLWAMGDLLQPYLDATDQPGRDAAMANIVTQLKPVETKDVEISFEGDTVEQERDGVTWGANKKQYTSDKVKITGKIAFAGSGTAGAPPAYREMFLLSGHAEIIDAGAGTVTYKPITEGFEYGVIAFVQDGQFHIGHKAQCEIKLDANAGEIGYWGFEITMTGGTIPIETPAGLTTVISGYQPPKAVNFSNTPIFQLGGQYFANSKFSHTTGNEIAALDIVNHQSAVIGDRKPKADITIGAKALSEVNQYQQAWDGEEMPLLLEHGKVAGEKIRFQYPAVSLSMPTPSDIQGALGYDIECTAMDHADGVYSIIFS